MVQFNGQFHFPYILSKIMVIYWTQGKFAQQPYVTVKCVGQKTQCVSWKGSVCLDVPRVCTDRTRQ